MTVWQAPPAPALVPRTVHVWRLLPRNHDIASAWPFLSDDERTRAERFHFAEHRDFFVSTHALVRRILATYVDAAPEALRFLESEFGKPSLAEPASGLEFNLSHSGELALLAVSHARVGIDVERWQRTDDLVNVADHFFSAAEQRALRELVPNDEHVQAGFFAAWSRKEAYLKATGAGVTKGLDHFAMSLTPGEQARLLHDERDPLALDRWYVTSIDVGPGYSAALVAEQPVDEVLFFE